MVSSIIDQFGMSIGYRSQTPSRAMAQVGQFTPAMKTMPHEALS